LHANRNTTMELDSGMQRLEGNEGKERLL